MASPDVPGLYESKPDSYSHSNNQPPNKGKGRGNAPVEKPDPFAAPAASTPWGTAKCLQWFRHWRGSDLIGKYLLSQASTCAKGLAENYTEEQVIAVRTLMNDDAYWKARGGADVCEVGRNIHREIKKLPNKSPSVPSSPPSPEPRNPAPATERTAEEKAALEEKKRRILAGMEEQWRTQSPPPAPVVAARALPQIPKEVLYGHR